MSAYYIFLTNNEDYETVDDYSKGKSRSLIGTTYSVKDLLNKWRDDIDWHDDKDGTSEGVIYIQVPFSLMRFQVKSNYTVYGGEPSTGQMSQLYVICKGDVESSLVDLSEYSGWKLVKTEYRRIN